MEDSKQDARVAHSGRGLLEFTYRFATVMLDKDLMTVCEASEMLTGVGNALEFGKNTPGIIDAYQHAMERALSRGMG